MAGLVEEFDEDGWGLGAEGGEFSKDFGRRDVHGVQKFCVVPHGCAKIWVLMTGTAQELKQNFEVSPHKRLSIEETLGRLEQLCKVV